MTPDVEEGGRLVDDVSRKVGEDERGGAVGVGDAAGARVLLRLLEQQRAVGGGRLLVGRVRLREEGELSPSEPRAGACLAFS